jgi:hypothetical protein
MGWWWGGWAGSKMRAARRVQASARRVRRRKASGGVQAAAAGCSLTREAHSISTTFTGALPLRQPHLRQLGVAHGDAILVALERVVGADGQLLARLQHHRLLVLQEAGADLRSLWQTSAGWRRGQSKPGRGQRRARSRAPAPRPVHPWSAPPPRKHTHTHTHTHAHHHNPPKQTRLRLLLRRRRTLVSSMTAHMMRVSRIALRRLSSVSWWYSWEPWEKLKRATFMPQRSISHSVGTLRGGEGIRAAPRVSRAHGSSVKMLAHASARKRRPLPTAAHPLPECWPCHAAVLRGGCAYCRSAGGSRRGAAGSRECDSCIRLGTMAATPLLRPHAHARLTRGMLVPGCR